MIHPSSPAASSRRTTTVLTGFLLAAALAPVAGCGQGGGSEVRTGSDGQVVYEAYCASCHGLEGDGKGQAAYLLFPKPRNFQRAQFKLRSTPPGELPTDADLTRTIQQGIPGSSMFSFGELLDDAQIAAVISYVKSLSPRFAEASPLAADQLLQVPAPPTPTARLVEAGKQAYADLGCAKCHGHEGRGDGPSAATLRDGEGDPFPAADFSYGIFKSGGSPEALYRTFLLGMEGTPMPSFQGAFQGDDQLWGLVYYILSLAPDGHAQSTDSDPGPLVMANLTAGNAAEDPWSPAWDGVPPHRVALRPLWYRNDYPPFVTARAGRVGDRLALLLEWQDETHDTDTLRTEHFADGVAVQFALSDPPPFVGMGRDGAKGEVEIWYWRADRQAASETGSPAALSAEYPHIAVDRYQHARGGAPGVRPYSDGKPTAADEAPFVPARDLGNPVADSDLSRRPVHVLAAAGFGTLTGRPADSMAASGHGGWQNGIYRVLFVAPIRPTDPALEASFEAGSVPMAVAIWNGSAGDRNGTKLVSQWFHLLAQGGSPPGQDNPEE